MSGDERADGHRFPLIAVWLASMLILAAVVFREISVFLLRIEGSSHSYGPSVFTGFHLKFWDTDALMAAAGRGGVWHTNELAKPFVSWHLTLDMVFPLLLGWALLRCLVAVAEDHPRDRRKLPRSAAVVLLPLSYVGFDLAETGYTFAAMQCQLRGLGCEFEITTHQARMIHLLSDLKWVALVLTLLTIAGFYFWSASEGAISWQRRREFQRRLKQRNVLVVGPPAGTVVVVSLLLVLLALPGGSALDQMPDVIRAQIDQVQGDEWQHAVYSVVSLLLFLMTLLVIVHPARKPVAWYDEHTVVTTGARWARLRSRHALCLCDLAVVGGGVALSAGLVVMHRIVEDAWDLPLGLAPGIVVVVVFVVAVSTTDFRRHLDERRKEHREKTPDPVVDPAQLEEAVSIASGYARLRAALLPGVLVLGVGLALVRATLPTFMAPDESQTAEFVVLLIGLTLAAVLSVLVAWFLDVLYRSVRLGRRLRWVLAIVLGLVNLVAAVILATRPARGGELGAVAVVVVALSAWLCVVAVFSLLSRHVVWQRTVDLKLGRRTPWLTLSMVVWVVAGVLDSSGGYHDTRTVVVPESQADDASRMRTLDEAYRAWAAQFGQPATQMCDDVIVDTSGRRLPTESNDTRKVPLVLVAAPGGGGKAAYWTALGMDKTFSSGGFCPQSLFVASGVSGGSIGLTAALAIPPAVDEVEDDEQAARQEDDPEDNAVAGAGDQVTPEDAEDAVRRMTDEGPLSATIAALLLRDMPQPFTTLRDQWRDRAAVLEDAWADAAPEDVFQDLEGDRNRKSLLELGEGWWTARSDAPPVAEESDEAEERDEVDAHTAGPVLLLNGASVNDGCRVLVSNVRGISSGNRGCLAAPITAIDSPPGGAVSGSLDVLDNLLPGRAEESAASDEETEQSYCAVDPESGVPAAQTLRATTGALLSARFPYLTPAGAMRRCLNVTERNLNEESAKLSGPAQIKGERVPEEDPAEQQKRLLSDTSYVVDGGYLENTGILSLLQVWEQIEPLVVACNAAAAADMAADADAEDPADAGAAGADSQSSSSTPPFDGCPQDAAGHLLVEPWFVMLENHYRSRVVPALSTDRPAEVFVPLATMSRKSTTLGTTPLEQAIAIAVSRAYVSSPDAPPVVRSCNRFVRLAPLKSPVVEAPLGWVLADDTRRGMREAMLASWDHNLTVYGGATHHYLQQRCTTLLDRIEEITPDIGGDDRRRKTP